MMIKKIRNLLADNIELWTGKRDALTPPARKNFVGDGDFRQTGEEFFKYFVELGALAPGQNVLDVGCGIGRMAVPLAGYLDKSGSYEGFDIVKKGIDWCKLNITRRYPNFRFQLADIYNKNYNPKGKYPASAYRFPYNDDSFDFVFLTSVFTHMLPPDMENYFSEIARTLKDGGRCLVTFFLANDESMRLMGQGKTRLDFKYDCNNYRTIDKDKPEAAVCYDEKFILDIYKKYGFKINGPIHYGSWCGRPIYLSCQDLIVAVKD